MWGLLLPAHAAEERGPSGLIPVIPAVSITGPSAPRLPGANGLPAGFDFSTARLALPPAAPGFGSAQAPGASARAELPGQQASILPQAQASGVRLPGAEVVPGVSQAPNAAPFKAPAATVPGATSAAEPGVAKIISELASDNAAHLSGEQASDLAGRLIDPRSASAGDEPFAVQASGPQRPNSVTLAPWQRLSGGDGGAWSGLGDGSNGNAPQPPKEPKPSLRDRAHYGRLYVENLKFYLYTNIVNKWGPYLAYWKKMKATGTPPPISRPRAFFATMRVFGQTGEFYIPGFTPREDQDVLSEARETFNRFFDAPYIGDKERQAFEGFLQRAILYNAERRAASKFRANVRDNLLKASTMTPEKIAPFFDGLPIMQKTAEFQNGASDAILEQFRAMALEEVAKEPQDAKDRITGVILIGSFALGAATPKSDFDVEPLTADGGSGRVREFADRVTKRWEAMSRQESNPVSFHYFGYLNSRWEIRAIHHEPYLIISPDAAIVENLAMRPGEPPSHVPQRRMTLKGRFLRWLQYAAVTLTSLTVRASK
jgi:predicted nucleotidyltransferase